MATSDDSAPAHRATAARLSWSPEGLRVPLDLSTGVIARKSLSVSSAGAIESCPARWAGEKLFPTADTPFDPAVVGNAGHDVLEALFDLPRAERTPDAAAKILDEMLTEIVTSLGAGTNHDYGFSELADRAAQLRWTSAIWNGIVTLWEIEDPTTVDVYATEFEVKDVTVGGAPFGGFIDRIDRIDDKHGDPALRLVDYKTGKYIDASTKKRFGDAHGDQLRLYAEAVETLMAELPEDHPDHGLKVAEAHDYYTKHAKSTKVALSAPYRKATVAAHAVTWDKHNDIIAAGNFPAKPSGLCSFCPLVRQCPSRAEKINWARVKPYALTVADAPIMAPIDEYAPHPLPFGDPWDQQFITPDWLAEEWIEDDWDEAASSVSARPAGLPIPASMNPFEGIEDGRYVAERDPFLSPVLPEEAAPSATVNGGAAVPAQHRVQTTPFHPEAMMNDNQDGKLFEDLPYKDDPMNIASYRHLTANHIVNKALSQIRKAGINGPDLTQQLISSTASILWNVVTTVQEQIIGHRNLHSAVSRNLMYSLEEVLELDPMPLVAIGPDGQARYATSDEITAWGVTAIGRLGALASIGVGIAHNGGSLAAATDFRGNPLGARRGPVPAQSVMPEYSGAPQFQSNSFFGSVDEEQQEANTFDPAFNY